MLLFSQFNGFAFSPPDIQTPNNIFTCSDYTVNLTMQNSQILGALNPDLYTVSYFLTNADAEADQNEIINATTFNVNISQIIYVRVTDNAVPTDYSIVSFNIIVEALSATIVTQDQTVCLGSEFSVTFQGSFSTPPYTFTYNVNGGANQIVMSDSNGFATVSLSQIQSGSYTIVLTSVQSSGNLSCNQSINESITIGVIASPTINPPLNISIEQIPYVGVANFDLTSNDLVMTNGQPELTISYYLSQFDAEASVNSIFPATSFSATNGQTIWAKVDSNTGCTVIRSFKLYITNPDIVFIPDANFKAKLLSAGPNNPVAYNSIWTSVVIDTNLDGEIQYSEAGLIYELYVNNSNISSLEGISAFNNLRILKCQSNQLTSLDVSSLTFMQELDCSFNLLTSLNLGSSPFFSVIYANNNLLEYVNLSGLSSVGILYLNNNSLFTLDVSNLTNLSYLDCHANQLTSLDVSGLTRLIGLYCQQNQLTSLNLITQNLLANQIYAVNCSDNNLTSVKIPYCESDIVITTHNNPNLLYIDAKNGFQNSIAINSSQTPLLEYICIDDNDNVLNMQEITVSIGSYCNFTPGGDYNTITGKIIFDENDNGCDENDSTFPNIRMNLQQWADYGSTFTNASGSYTFYTTAADHLLAPAIENAAFFTVSPPEAIISFTDIDQTITQNFCITPNGVHPDLEIVITPTVPARPGFDATYKIVYHNKGNQTLSQQYGINFFYNQNLMEYVSASVVPSQVTSGGISWDYTNLKPFESREIVFTLNINAPTDTNPVNNGDVLTFTTSIMPQAGDENTSDNTFVLDQTVVGSYDPNDITCLEGDIVSPTEIGEYLHYNIRFENTGTFFAENIVVKTEINPAEFDINTLQLLNASHAVDARIRGNIIEFIFQGIYLETGGHGNVLLKVKTKPSLQTGDLVKNKANIYFDYNFPILTNDAETVFQSLSNPDFEVDNSVKIYPNPSNALVNIKSDFNIKSIQLYDVQGRILQTNIVEENTTTLDIASKAKGVYFLKVVTDRGIKVEKLVKE